MLVERGGGQPPKFLPGVKVSSTEGEGSTRWRVGDTLEHEAGTSKALTLTVWLRSDRDRMGCCVEEAPRPEGTPPQAARPAERSGHRAAGLLEFMARLYDNGNIFLIEVCTTITLLI